MRRFALDEPRRLGGRVRAVVAEGPRLADVDRLLSGVRAGLRGISCGDGRLYVWDADDAIHVDVARALGYGDGDHADVWFVREGTDPFGPRDDWGLDDRDPVVGTVRLLPGLRGRTDPTLRALGFAWPRAA